MTGALQGKTVRALVEFQGIAFTLDTDDPSCIRYSPFGDLDFIKLMSDATGDGPSPAVETMAIEDGALVFRTPIGVYRMTGDVRDFLSVRIDGPSNAG